jgi:hypothetical protein
MELVGNKRWSKPVRRRFERLSLVSRVLDQINAERPQSDDHHATRERRAIAVVGFAEQDGAEHVAVEANTAVKVPDRKTHVGCAGYLRMSDIALHGLDGASNVERRDRFRQAEDFSQSGWQMWMRRSGGVAGCLSGRPRLRQATAAIA